jgi:Fis family transcriptional regulator
MSVEKSTPVTPVQVTPLRDQVHTALQTYLSQLDGHPLPGNLYKLVLQEVEHPLLQTVMHYTGGNQSKAADILGIDRSTLRKKLKQYDLG